MNNFTPVNYISVRSRIMWQSCRVRFLRFIRNRSRYNIFHYTR